VHVGGTNGKGSVAGHLDAVLRQAGHRTGLYSSPHLCTFRERIRIDGSAITEAALLRAAERLWPAIRLEEPSFFEATTALAFLALAEAGVEVAVVEVGLGGRLDATNVVDPDVVVLTNVSLDHVQLLGPPLRQWRSRRLASSSPACR
jgi:dihydrofolate synthase/folylpolyglutamate synthase